MNIFGVTLSLSWYSAVYLYMLVALISLSPTLRAVFRKIKLHDGGDSFSDSPHFSNSEKEILKQHYSRIQGTLIFWKNTAEKYRSFHYYCLFWTIPISILIPIVTQAISANNSSKLFLTVMSTHAAILLAFHRGFKVENNFKAFRHGESDFYDLYRKLLDSPSLFGKTSSEQIEAYFRQAEQIRKHVRTAETDNFPTLEEVNEQLRSLTNSTNK